MHYYKTILNGYLMSVSTGIGGIEITKDEYETLLNIILNKPAAPDATHDYWITEDGEYELVEIEPLPEPEPTAEEALTRYANELTGENDPDLVAATETLITKFTEFTEE